MEIKEPKKRIKEYAEIKEPKNIRFLLELLWLLFGSLGSLISVDPNIWILAFSTIFCPIKTDLSGNTIWQQA